MASHLPTIVPLDAIDRALIEDLLDAAFGDDRRARTAYRIREGVDWLPGLSFAALDDEDYLVATIQLWPIALTDPDGRAHPMLMVGPVAVMPGRQGEGYGKALMAAALAAVDRLGAGSSAALPQVLIGDFDYYGKWDFTPAHTGGWHCPGPYARERLLARTANAAILPREGMLGPWMG